MLVADAAGKVVGLARPGTERADVRSARPEVSSDFADFQGYARAPSVDDLRLYAASHDGRALCKVGGAK